MFPTNRTIDRPSPNPDRFHGPSALSQEHAFGTGSPEVPHTPETAMNAPTIEAAPPYTGDTFVTPSIPQSQEVETYAAEQAGASQEYRSKDEARAEIANAADTTVRVRDLHAYQPDTNYSQN